jgi:DNA polymerase III epsilon subunit-like protein
MSWRFSSDRMQQMFAEAWALTGPTDQRRARGEACVALFLDTETTGFSPAYGHSIIEVAIVGERGRTIVNTLINPGYRIPRHITWITGIDSDMVANAPTFKRAWPTIREIISGEELVIYKAKFDRAFFPRHLSQAKRIHCAMSRFQELYGGRSRSLAFAAKYVRYRWKGDRHRALSDALACRSVWIWSKTR